MVCEDAVRGGASPGCWPYSLQCSDEVPRPAADRKHIRLNGRLSAFRLSDVAVQAEESTRLHLDRQAPIDPHRNRIDRLVDSLPHIAVYPTARSIGYPVAHLSKVVFDCTHSMGASGRGWNAWYATTPISTTPCT